MKDGLIDTILEVIPATEQKAEGVKKQEDRHNNHTMTKEKEYEIKEKYRPGSPGSA